MLENYGYIGLFLVVAILFTATTILLPVTLRLFRLIPKNPDPVKNDTFECGLETIGNTWVQFNFRYYFYALIFLVLDVLVIFIYPWAVATRELGYSGLMVVLVLVGIVATGYVYAWKKKVLEWK